MVIWVVKFPREDYKRGVHVVLVSLADQFTGQFLNFFWSAKRKLSSLREWTILLVHSLEFFDQSFLKIGQSLVSRLDKKDQESGQKKLSGL